jgi:hypothetical protein
MKRLLLLSICAGLGISTARAQQTYNLVPYLTCISTNPVDGSLTAYFGYDSYEQSVLQLIVGSLNSFLPDPANRNQQTLFLPGHHEKSVVVTIPAGNSLLWLINGYQIFVDNTAPACSSSTLNLPAGYVGVPYSQQLAAGGGQAALTWGVGGLPTGLNATSSGFITGTPQLAGQYTVTAGVSDGFNTSSRTYGLTVYPSLAIDDAKSTRAQGFSPQFRVATMPSSTISATVSCNLNEFVVTGGGGCTVPGVNTVQGRIATSQPAANGWTVVCSGGTATAVAVCSLQ